MNFQLKILKELMSFWPRLGSYSSILEFLAWF